jgi:predicted TIM-barrel fold metal-dependent hydrolase
MSRVNDRRTILKETLVLSAAATTTLSAKDSTKVETDFPIIDTHQHLWDLKKFRLPWLKKNEALNRSYVMDDYLAAVGELAKSPLRPAAKVVKAVYMEVDVDPAQQAEEAEHLIARCREGGTPTVAAVISGRPASPDFGMYLKPFRDSRYIKGVRQVLHTDATLPGYCLGKAFIQGVQVLGKLGLSFDLCMRNADLPDAARLIDACPDTRFILDHCGNADVQAKERTRWKKDMAEVAKRKNIVCKVSGFIASAKKGEWSAEDLAPVVNHTLEVFGPDRVMFGGDWPVCTLAASFAQWVDALRAVVKERRAEEQRKLFHDNAAKFYRLS